MRSETESEPDDGARQEREPPDRRSRRANLPHVAAGFYLFLFLVAWAWIRLRGDTLVPAGERGFLVEGGAGMAAGLIIAAFSFVLSRFSRPARLLEAELGDVLGPLSAGQILALAAMSGLVEEVFFRAAVQPALGLVAASILFGALHTGPRLIFLLWTAFAVGMGFLLGWFYEATGALAAPVALHFSVNALNLWRITREAGPRGLTPPARAA